jgi:hypothetical protein
MSTAQLKVVSKQRALEQTNTLIGPNSKSQKDVETVEKPSAATTVMLNMFVYVSKKRSDAMICRRRGKLPSAAHHGECQPIFKGRHEKMRGCGAGGDS